MAHVYVGKAGSFGITPRLIDSMLRVRAHAFADRLGWEVNVQGGRELDYYDAIAPTYIIATDDVKQRCLGCTRLLPTTGPNMLRDVFGAVLECEVMPAASDVWDVSRFAIAEDVETRGMGFSDVPASILRGMMEFARENGITQVVGVTTTAVDRMLRGFGFDVVRLGVEKRIGTARTVAFSLPVTDAVLDRIGVPRKKMAA